MNKFITASISIVSLIVIIALSDSGDATPEAYTAPPTEAEVRQDKYSHQFHPYDGAHIKLERWIKNNLKDPDSYEHIRTGSEDRGDHFYIQLKYRAKNSFGGYVVEYQEAKVNVDGDILEVIEIN